MGAMVPKNGQRGLERGVPLAVYYRCASQLPERRLTGTLTAHAKILLAKRDNTTHIIKGMGSPFLFWGLNWAQKCCI